MRATPPTCTEAIHGRSPKNRTIRLWVVYTLSYYLGQGCVLVHYLTDVSVNLVLMLSFIRLSHVVLLPQWREKIAQNVGFINL